MQFVETINLKPGMRLAKPVYNKMGVMLYDRNSYLTAMGIHSIENFGLIGLFILEPAEPLPPLSDEEIAFEQFQTIYMFRAKSLMDRLQLSKSPDGLTELAESIIAHYGGLDHKIHFTQTLRSASDFVYKHTISTAILAAMLAHALKYSKREKLDLVMAALLFDIGYLFVPRIIIEKGDDLTDNDVQMLFRSRQKGYELLFPETNRYSLPGSVLTIIHQILFALQNENPKDQKNIHWLQSTKVLLIADKFDRSTAMNLHHQPMSEIAAIRHLYKHPEFYPKPIVDALAQCVHVLPRGASVDLTNGDKGIIVKDNTNNFMEPVILDINNNKLLDLSDPETASKLQIRDIMKTMDNRITIDEETIRQFVTDDALNETLVKFQNQKNAIIQRHTKGSGNRLTN